MKLELPAYGTVRLLLTIILGMLAYAPAKADIATSQVPCTVGQKQILTKAMAKAKEGIVAAMGALDDTSPGAINRYTLWFGAPSSANVAEVKKTYANALAFTSIANFWCPVSNSPEFKWNVNEPAAAYPRSAPTAIYFSPEFFKLEETGADSKAGTIVHELTHLAAVKNTEDHAYGTANAKVLAKDKPAHARSNADNYQYFLEAVLFGI
jgi:hypothetical protein